MVRRAIGVDDAAAAQALAMICAGYWYPIYAFIRQEGNEPHDAEDLTQEFFTRMLRTGLLALADPDKGRLRNFLFGCVKHFLSDQYDRARAKKRGAHLLTSFDAVQAEKRYAAEPVDDLSPDRLFQRRWAVALLGETLRLLEHNWVAAHKKVEIFSALRPFLVSDVGEAKSYAELSVELRLEVSTIKSHVSRLRQGFKKLLLKQVADTLDDPTPERIRAELSELRRCV